VSRAIVVREIGGPEVLKLESRDVGEPGPGQVKIRNEAIGLNFIDVYHRIGLYKVDLPFTPGVEGAGTVTAVGQGVSDFHPGDRVAYAGPLGAYSDDRLIPADKLVRVPDMVDFDIAAAVVSKAGTAHYLLFETWPFKAGDTMLVHAAAGGVGSFLVQWASSAGATVIALAGSDDKLKNALENGASLAFNSNDEDWVHKVRDATGGRGVDVVYDGVGKATFERSLDCLRPRGLMVSYGNASGPVTGVSLSMLQTRGSLYVTRPTTAHYYGDTEGLRRTMARVFGAVTAGHIRPSINQRFPLDRAADAHRALEARATTGATLLIP
jgi:NADPH2:quinone reductase